MTCTDAKRMWNTKQENGARSCSAPVRFVKCDKLNVNLKGCELTECKRFVHNAKEEEDDFEVDRSHLSAWNMYVLIV